MVKRNENLLQGMDEIATYLGVSHDTVLTNYYRNLNLPITKTGRDGTWVGWKKKIDTWIEEVLTKYDPAKAERLGHPKKPAPARRKAKK